MLGIDARGTAAARILTGRDRREMAPRLGRDLLEAATAGVTGDGTPRVGGRKPVGDHGTLSSGARLRPAGGSSTLRTDTADTAAEVIGGPERTPLLGRGSDPTW